MIIAKVRGTTQPNTTSRRRPRRTRRLKPRPRRKPRSIAGHDAFAEEISTERTLWRCLSVVLALSASGSDWSVQQERRCASCRGYSKTNGAIDEIYNGYIVDPITKLSREGLWKGFDLGFIDGIVNGIGHFVIEVGNLVAALQVGFVRGYAAIILLGALAVIGYFIYYGLKLIGFAAMKMDFITRQSSDRS